jgi:TonB-linked SusC/RagA family outer membrane protein
MTGIGFESNAFIQNIGAAQTKIISDQLQSEYRYAAVFGRLNYQYKNKYILNITGRRDGSSRFGPNNRFANFGAVGAAWLFTKEPFLSQAKWLSFGKLRGSFGTAGSDNIGDYQYLDSYIVSPSSVYNGTTGLLPSRLYNPDYSWEKTRKLEMALELGLFKNRLNVTAAWYRNRSSNQLVGYQLPAVTGFGSVLANLDATVENTGLEFEVSARPLSSGSLQWETGFNISFPRNKLISFPGLEGSTYANQYVIGQPTSIVKVYHLEGIDPKTGQYQFTDFNGDGKISSPDDNKVIENIGVEYFGGWSNTLRYKNWDLTFLVQFVKQRNRNYNYIMPVPGSMNNQPVEVMNVWSADNPNGVYMPYHSGSSASHILFQNSDAAISDASFIRLKNVQLGYRIPLQNSVFKDVKIYFQGQNLVTWTRYFGIDPEFLFMGFLPPLRTFSFGLQFNL